MKNEEYRNMEKRVKDLEKNSHPPVNWKELIHSNIDRIDELEDMNSQLMDIIKNITIEKKELKERVEVMEKIIRDFFPNE